MTFFSVFRHPIVRLMTISAALLGVLWAVPASVQALSQDLSLKQLAIEDVIYLPTVSSQREIAFTVPETWQIGSTRLDLVFQHSSQLLPDRSYLEVILNDKPVRRIPLTRANAEQSHVTLPLSGLKRDNLLKFRVEQHYTDKCEDPVDASLWTNVLNDTRLTFQYQMKPIHPSLAQFPAPLVDGDAFDVPPIQYVVPEQQVDGATVTAVARLQAALGMAGRKLQLTPKAHMDFNAALNRSGHVVVVATPAQIKAMDDWARLLHSVRLQNSQWVKAESGQPLSGNEAVVRLLPKPGEPGYGVLVVTANTTEGLLNGVNYLTHQGTASSRKADEILVASNWSAGTVAAVPKPRYINEQSMSLAELGFGDQYVEKLFAPPIQFDIPVVSNVDKGGASVDLQVAYGYAAGLNPRYSSLEWRLNNKAIANIPLTNQAGVDKTQATIKVPVELLKPHNTLVAQFHMMPDKYGFCVDDFEDNAWGKIFTSESRLNINGSPASRLPSIGLLNSTGFPYTSQMDMQGTTLVLADNAPSLAAWDAWLALANRLGRMGDAPAGYQFTAAVGQDALKGVNGHVLALGPLASSSLVNGLPIQWDEASQVSIAHPTQGNASLVMGGAVAPEWQQGRNSVGLLSVQNDAGYHTLASILSSDDRFEDIGDGQVIHSAEAAVGGNDGIALSSATLDGGNGGGHTLGSHGSSQGGFGFLDPILQPILNFGPIKLVLDLISSLIHWFVGLPVISHVIGFVFGLIWPVLTFGPLAAITGWFQQHTILGFMAGSVVFWLVVTFILGIIGWLIGLITRRGRNNG